MAKRRDKYPNHCKYWTKADMIFLEDCWKDMNIEVCSIAKSLGRTIYAVRTKAAKMGLHRYFDDVNLTVDDNRMRDGELDAFVRDIMENVETDEPAVKSAPVVIPYVQPTMKDVDLEDSVTIRLCKGDAGSIKAFVKFKGGWSVDKITHPYAMQILKDVDVLGVVKNV